MPLTRRVPLRDLGSLGIIRDAEPYTLPLGAFSSGQNVRFENGQILRAPGFRTISQSADISDPQFVFAARPSTSNDFLVYADDNGRMYTYQTAEIDITPLSFVNSPGSGLPFSAAILDQVVYINRKTDVPYFLDPASSLAQPLTAYGWSATDRAGVMRSWKDFLIALDITKNGVEFPNMVKVSDAQTGDQLPPASWDATDPTTLALENPLPDLEGRLLDGAPLRDSFFLYSNAEVWRMDLNPGSSLVFDFTKVFDDEGILATGLVVAANNRHYVWAEHDIFEHDGVNKRSIVEGRNREYIFERMKKAFRDEFFVAHNPVLDEIVFGYVADDFDLAFPETPFPNRLAIYNYREDTWSFQDAPSIVGIVELTLIQGDTWDTDTALWNEAGGTWNADEDGARSALYCLRHNPGQSQVYAYDVIGPGSVVVAPLDVSATPPATLERIKIDLDEVSAELRGYKNFEAIYPQIRIFDEDTATIDFSFGGSQFSQDPNAIQETSTFNPVTEQKVSSRAGGRYMSFGLTFDSPADFKFSGFDLEYKINSRR